MSHQQTKINAVIHRLETVKSRLESLSGGRGASGGSGASGVDTIQTGAFKESIVKIEIHSH